MSIQAIPLSQLHATYLNVRKTGGASVESLAASIVHHGLIHNLTVTRNDSGYAVVAGGRRLKALQALQEAGTLPETLAAGIPCRVIEDGQSREASLAENVMRHAMHPADECDAFARLVDDGLPVSEIAARFGQSELFVRQRLKLANVAPDILADYRAGNATLEQMMALALTDDQAVQLRVWKAAKNEWQREPRRLREVITQQELAADSSLAKFVGLAAYEKAGGQVRRDMFGTDADAFLMDAELAEKLALEKLERTAEKIRKEGWLWVEPRLKFEYYQHRDGFGNAPSEYKGSKETWSAEAKAHAGAIVSLGYNGQAEIKRGLVRPADRKAMTAATGEKVSGGKDKPAHKPGELSFAAVQRLQAEASDIIALDLSTKPKVAIALLAAELADSVFYDGWVGSRTFVHISREAGGRMHGNIAKISGRAPAANRMDDQLKEWKALLPRNRSDARAWILRQDEATVEKLLAFLVAREVDGVEVSAGSKKETVADLADMTQTDLSAAWSPTEEWLATLPKAAILDLAKGAGAPEVELALLRNVAKANLPGAALKHFPEGWLPPPLRPRSAPKAKKAAPPKKSAAPTKAAKKPVTKKPAARKAKNAPEKKAAKGRAK